MPPLVFCRKSDGSLVPAGAASRIVLKIKLGSVCTAERVPTPEDVRVLSNQKLQSRECTLLRSLLIQNALENLDQTNILGLSPPRKVEILDLAEPCWSDEEDKENNCSTSSSSSSLEDSGIFEMTSSSDSEEMDVSETSSVVAALVPQQEQLVQSEVPAVPQCKSRVGKGKPLCLKRKEIQSQQQQHQMEDITNCDDKPSKRARTSGNCGRDESTSLNNYGVQSIVSCI